jgi:hypothetical protein
MENELFTFFSKYMELSEDEKKAIVDLDIFKDFKKGSVLLKEGDISNDDYFVIKGCLRCYYMVDGEEKTTAFYTEFESLTPSVNKTPSDQYVVCAEDSLITVTNSNMEKVNFEKFPRFETLCRLRSEELLVKNQSAFDIFRHASPEQRYLNLMETRPDLLQRIPLHQLASYLGMKPESLSRIRKRILADAKS